MDRNTTIGLILLFGLFIIWWQINSPSQAEIEAQRQKEDSIRQAQMALVDTLPEQVPEEEKVIEQTIPDSVLQRTAARRFGSFGPSATGEMEQTVIANEKLQLTFQNKGGRIVDAWLKEKKIIREDEEHKDYKEELHLLNNPDNRFEYILPLRSGQVVRTGDLYFQKTASTASSVTYRAYTEDGGYFEQKYSLSPDVYTLEYEISFQGLQNSLDTEKGSVEFAWENYLNKLEKNVDFERYYSTVYYKQTEEDPDYCNCRKSDLDVLPDQRIKWVAHSNQFFSTNLIARESFGGGVFETVMLDNDAEALKLLRSNLSIPYRGSTEERFAMDMFIGPNDFDRLAAFDMGLTQIIPFGWSIFGTINRWVVRPLFNLLHSGIGNLGIVIIILTFIVKMLLYPLTYKMLYSQAKMAALKPVLAGLKEKFKDDTQKQQMESMKIYREYGVSPFGGCMPMVLQMPIWFALYRFFPASIEFRQTGFLWANDLSSYDAVFHLPFDVPMYGAHVSLFTLLWGVSLLGYTYYNSRHIDLTAGNPMMKYMQYIMPFAFLVFLNKYASGLTCYLLFSNTFNILQTVITKKFIIDDDKIKAELRKNKEKPKKKGKFQQRLESAMKEQQRTTQKKSSKKK